MGTWTGGKTHKAAFRKAEKRKRYYARHPEKKGRAARERGHLK